MLHRRSVSISRQISRVVIVTASCAVVLTMLAMVAVAIFLARSTSLQRAGTIAELVAANADVPLVLKDVERGREALAALASSDAVVQARLLEISGKEFVSYLHKAHASDGAGDGWWARLVHVTEITVRKPVIDGGDLLGYSEVTIREQNLAFVLLAFTASGAAVLAIMVLGWMVISGPIGRHLSAPLTRFAEITRRVRDTQDFTHRVPTTRVAEVQRLSEDFNAMLRVIQRRTSEVEERNRELARLAFYDPLTGAANRILLLDRMTQLIDGHSRDARPFAVIGFDLDEFKLLNDHLGHQVGDAFLKAMSHRCKTELRPTDTFARLGGDEFIALLPNVATAADAQIVARKLADAVHAANHVHTLPISCTASMGIGLYPQDGLSTNELMARVDAAMYEAKAAGRNQVRFVHDVMMEQTAEEVRHES